MLLDDNHYKKEKKKVGNNTNEMIKMLIDEQNPDGYWKNPLLGRRTVWVGSEGNCISAKSFRGCILLACKVYREKTPTETILTHLFDQYNQ